MGKYCLIGSVVTTATDEQEVGIRLDAKQNRLILKPLSENVRHFKLLLPEVGDLIPGTFSAMEL